jgi:hypothetical protein
MNLEEARKMWGYTMPDDILKKWLELRNKIVHDPSIPKGATVEVDNKTGKVIPSTDY